MHEDSQRATISQEHQTAEAVRPRKLVGRVTPAERDEIRLLFEHKNGLTELVRALTGMSREELDRSALYDRLVRDMGKTATEFQEWWSAKAKQYGWEGRPGHNWEIDFETCEIYLRTSG